MIVHPVYRPIPDDESETPRSKMPELPVEKRAGNFEEVELGYDETSGRQEAER